MNRLLLSSGCEDRPKGSAHTAAKQNTSQSRNGIAVTSVLLFHRAIADINEAFRDTFDCILGRAR